MKFFKFTLSLLATLALVWALNKSHSLKLTTLPAVGKLLSPFEGYWQNGEPLTVSFSDMPLPDLKDSVQVVYDNRLVPHIFAKNALDAYCVQGYIHASNRLWQMDFITRVAAGRLSEVLGDRILRGSLTTVENDKLMRRRGILRGAENTVAHWKDDAETMSVVNAYCAGANAYINNLTEKDYPVEYKIFGLKPQTWTPLHLALFAKYMAFDLAFRQDDLEATNAKALFSNDFDFLFPEYFKEQSPIVPVGTKWNSGSATALPKDSIASNDAMGFVPFQPLGEAKPDPSNGSNNWAVSGKKTKNGFPILCGDPHLNLRLPSIWFENQITTPEFNVYGVSLPGLPTVIIGFNDNISWTQTNVGHDVADWYSIKWKDNKKMEYLYDGAYRKVETRIEQISINGKEPVFDTVRYTVWGPVVYENDTLPRANMAFHWLANEMPESTISVFVKLNKARNYAEYSEAINAFNVPAQNFAFACKNGDIALKVMGLFPKKAKGQGRFVQDGTSSANKWQGFIPKDQVPQYRNPARGYVSSANQHSTDPSYPFYYNSEGFEGFRGRIVNMFLDTMKNITVKDMMRMQNSNYSLHAAEALPLMLKNIDSTAVATEGGAILNELKNWNYYFDADKAAPIYFEEWWKAFYTETWDEVLTHPKKDIILTPSTWRTVFLLRDDTNNKYFDKTATNDKKETAKDILTAAFKTMLTRVALIKAEIELNYPKDPTLTWGHAQDTEVPHVSMIPGFGRYHLNIGGHARSINSIKKSNGPSWRMIVEMGDTTKAWVVYPGGQSGNPGSPHYADYLEKWSKGKYYQALFMKKPDEQDKRITNRQVFYKK